jgi:pimeloyl-ACP methyl ester carboxylesterase
MYAKKGTHMIAKLRKHRKLLFIIAGVTLALAVAALTIIGWIASSKIIAVSTQKVEYDQTIQAINNNAYTISGSAYNVQGIMGGIRSDGSMVGIFSQPTDSNPTTATSTRTIASLSGAQPKVGDKLSLQGNIWTTNPKAALGLDYTDITYNSPVGSMKAWLISGTNSIAWTIGVHGIGADKTEMLRFVKPVHDAGDTMMVINYRNDAANPASPDGRNNLGNTEWQDLEAAVAYARAHGATTVNLYGDSLGGSLVENYLHRAKDSSQINRVVLDSPALDWEQILRHRAKSSGYPSIIYYPTVWVLRLRTGINVNSISTKATDIKQKTLIIHSSDDPNVPQAASKAIADAAPNLVTLVDFGHGGHLRSWNYDQARYEKIVTTFLSNK